MSILSLDSSISGRVSRFEIANPPSSFVSRSAFVFCFRRSCKHILRGHTSTIRCLKVLDGRPIAVSGSRDSTLRVWDIEKGVLLHLLSGHQHSVRCIEVAGNKVVSGSYDCTCRVSGRFSLFRLRFVASKSISTRADFRFAFVVFVSCGTSIRENACRSSEVTTIRSTLLRSMERESRLVRSIRL